MTTPTPAELVAFAQSLISIGHTEIRRGYLELLQLFRANPALGEQLRSKGFSAVLAGTDPLITSLQKDNKELVTDAEKRAERLMRDAIEHHYPSHTVTGEELPDQFGSDQWSWSIDPVDGTSAMIRSAMQHAYGLPAQQTRPAFGISIGVLHSDSAMLGAIGELVPLADDLVLGRTWLGGRGTAVTCDGVAIPAWPIRGPYAPALACTVPEIMFSTGAQWNSFQALAAIAATVIRDQNCLGFMGLLDGSIDVVYERDLLLPDAAAVVPILEAAGVTVTDQYGRSVTFEVASRGREYVLLAARQPLHQRAVALTSTSTPDAEDRSGATDSTQLGYVRKVTDGNG
ncbi:inositol monophosphatase family protein [Nocardia brasiliensis]